MFPTRNRAVCLVSSMQHRESLDNLTRKPKIIAFYNSTKGGLRSHKATTEAAIKEENVKCYNSHAVANQYRPNSPRNIGRSRRVPHICFTFILQGSPLTASRAATRILVGTSLLAAHFATASAASAVRSSMRKIMDSFTKTGYSYFEDLRSGCSKAIKEKIQLINGLDISIKQISHAVGEYGEPRGKLHSP
ncbi:hypothetical protein J437_LFUL018062, partial [Ladona fulva]